MWEDNPAVCRSQSSSQEDTEISSQEDVAGGCLRRWKDSAHAGMEVIQVREMMQAGARW